VSEAIATTQPYKTKKSQTPYLGFFIDPDGHTIGNVVDLRYPGPKHLLSFGTPGALKSMGLVVPNLATLKRSIICIDPKGQLCAITKRIREKMGRVIVVNPFGELLDVRGDMKSAGWNPMLQTDPASPDFGTDMRCIAEAMVERTGNSKGDFFETSMENMWQAFAMWERMTKGNKATLRGVLQRFAESPDELLATLKAMSKSDKFAVQLIGGATYQRMTAKNSQSTSLEDVKATIIKNAMFLTDDRIGMDMRKGGAIPFEKMQEEIITVYVVLPSSQLRHQAKWLRVFVNMALNTLFRSAPRKATLPPALIMLDEFGNLGRLPEIINAMNISRDYRFQLWMFLQYYSQLRDLYPKEWPAFFAGSGAVTTFATGDLETAKHFSELFGQREVEMTSRSRNGGNLITGFLHPLQIQLGESTTTQILPYMAPEDLGRLRKGEMRCRIDPCEWPIEGEAPGYWDVLNPEILQQLDPNPYYLG